MTLEERRMWKRKTYREIILDYMDRKPEGKTLEALEVTERFVEEANEAHPDKVERFLLKLEGALNNCHFAEYTAWLVIWDMVPVGVSQEEFKKHLPDVDAFCKEVAAAYEKAKREARERGFEAPSLSGEYNKWDMFVTGAMFHSDYWMMNPDNAALFVYQFLSDPDYQTPTKIWDYLVK